MKFAMVTVSSLLAIASAWAQDVPLKSPGDPRVRYLPYKADSSVVVPVRRGVATRLVLERDEAIEQSGSGFPASCESAGDEWCIRANQGEHQVWVKPRSGATHNNLELATNKRDYSIRFEVLQDSPKGDAPADEIYRVIFVYPKEGEQQADATRRMNAALSGESASKRAAAAVSASGNLQQLGCDRPRRIVNTSYSREEGSKAITPLRVFDDGSQTVFVFGDTSTMPAVFSVNEGRAEARVNFSVDGNCLVVHQLSPEFVLRAGSASLRVFNEAFLPSAMSQPLREQRRRSEAPE